MSELDDIRELYQAARQPSRPKAVIVDMDGSLVNVAAIRYHVKGPVKDFDAFHQESRHSPANQQALDFCERHHAAGHVIVVVTARKDRHFEVSKGWLEDNMTVPYDGPFMRPDDLNYSDVVIKRKIHKYLARHYTIVAACDDNPAICDLWVELGIPVEVIPGWEE